MVSFTDYYNAISIDGLPSKTKIGKGSWCFNNSYLCMPEFSSATISFKENAKILSKTSTTQENIKTSRQNSLFLLKKTKKTTTIIK